MNEKTKRKGFLRIAGIMAVILMIGMCVVAGTMAKYMSTGNATDVGTLQVAKWSIKVGETDIATSNSIALSDLSWTIEPIKDGGDNGAVEENKIAPGTWGYAAIVITNESDVDAEVTVTITNPISSSGNLKFTTVAQKTAPTSYAEATGSLSNIKLEKKSSTGNNTTTIYVCFEWKYDTESNDGTNDTADTSIGASTSTFQFTNLNLTATQVEPTAAGD